MDVGPTPPPSRRAWRSTVAGGLVVVAVAAVFVAWRLSTSGPHRPSGFEPSGDRAPSVGRPAPDFSLPTFAGGTLSLHSLKGKPVVLNFWASWCVPCREETPMLVRLHKVYGPRGIVFVGIDTQDEAGDARRFAAQYHVEYPLVSAHDERLIDAYALQGLPTTVFIGADGVVVGRVVGGFVGPEGEKLLTARLDRLLAGSQR